MFRIAKSSFATLFVLCICFDVNVSAQDATLQASLVAVQNVGNNGAGHVEALAAWRSIGAASVDSLPQILKSIDDEKPIAANWLRAAVDQIAERAIQAKRSLPKESLEQIVFDANYSPRARRLAYEWLANVDATAEARIIPRMLNDSSIEMRRDAVAQVLSAAEAAGDNEDDARKFYQLALAAARDQDQIDAAFDKLVAMGDDVDLPTHFGFITKWRLVGPFDNVDKKGFAVAYPPETEIVADKTYDGKTGVVKWFDHQTSDKYGMVDLNAAVGKNMGAVAYAVANFETSEAQDVELRLGCINAAKLWLNGKQLMQHEVYHSGTSLDQYVSRGRLNAGSNTILLKICQNEQTENWAQDWEFQLRVCDAVGTAILASNRAEPAK